VKAFPKGLYKHKAAEKQCSWPPRLPGKTNFFERKGVCHIHTQTKIKTSFDGLPEKFMQENAVNKL